MGGFLRIAFCAFVALGISAFVPPCFATADAFETPKTLFWCLTLVVASFCCFGSAPLTKRRGAGDWAAISLLGWMALRTLAAGTLLDWSVLVGWLLPPALYLAGVRLSRQPCATDNRQSAIIGVVGVIGVAQAALMVLQRFGLDPLFAATTNAQSYLPGRMIGTIGYHNQAVDLLAVCAALALWRVRRRRPGSPESLEGPEGRESLESREGQCQAVGKTAVALLPLALLGAIAAMAAYRAGFVGVLVGTAALLSARSWRGRRGVVAALGVAVALCAICLAVPQMRARAAGALTRPFATPALRTRATMARAAWAMICERPLFGHGSGSYAFQYMKRVSDGMPSEMGHEELGGVVYAREPHNDFLHLWCEFGLIGLVLALWWLIATWHRQPVGGRFLLGYWLVASCFGFPWHDTAAGPFFGLALGLMGGGSGSIGSQPLEFGSRPLPAIGKRQSTAPLAIGFAGAVLCLLQIGADIGRWRAFPWQGRALAREGGLLAMERRFAEAEEVLEASRRLERSPEQCNNLGFVKMKLGQPAKAEAIYREWADSGIDHAKALRSLAGAQEAQGKWLDAGRTLYRLHSLWPSESSDADLFRTASLLLRGGDAETALLLVRRFWRRNGQSTRWTAEWENLFGAAELRRGNVGGARVHFRCALEMKPSLESARRNLQVLSSREMTQTPSEHQ